MKTFLSMGIILIAMIAALPMMAVAATQEATITITPSTVNASSITGWIVEQKTGTTGTYAPAAGSPLAAGMVTLTVPNLPNATIFCFRATPTSAFGNGLPSADACSSTGGVPGQATISVEIKIK